MLSGHNVLTCTSILVLVMIFTKFISHRYLYYRQQFEMQMKLRHLLALAVLCLVGNWVEGKMETAKQEADDILAKAQTTIEDRDKKNKAMKPNAGD